jgi:hypothetical protein
MKKITMKVKVKGEHKDHTFVMPENLQEAVTILGQTSVFESFGLGYVTLQKKIAQGRKPREKRWAKIDLSALSDQEKRIAIDLLNKAGSKPAAQSTRTESPPLHNASEP